MNKSELVTTVAEKSSLSKKNCEAVLDAIIVTIRSALKNGDKVRLSGFCTFEVKERVARAGRNPRTKESIDIPAYKQPTFKPGKTLKESVL